VPERRGRGRRAGRGRPGGAARQDWDAKAGVTDLFTTEPVTVGESVKKLAKLPLHHHPGEKFTYSEGLNVLGTRPLSQAEFEAILSRLERSCRTFAQGPTSRNYIAALRRLWAEARRLPTQIPFDTSRFVKHCVSHEDRVSPRLATELRARPRLA
jgi:hypothetical protein